MTGTEWIILIGFFGVVSGLTAVYAALVKVDQRVSMLELLAWPATFTATADSDVTASAFGPLPPSLHSINCPMTWRNVSANPECTCGVTP